MNRQQQQGVENGIWMSARGKRFIRSHYILTTTEGAIMYKVLSLNEIIFGQREGVFVSCSITSYRAEYNDIKARVEVIHRRKLFKSGIQQQMTICFVGAGTHPNSSDAQYKLHNRYEVGVLLQAFFCLFEQFFNICCIVSQCYFLQDSLQRKPSVTRKKNVLVDMDTGGGLPIQRILHLLNMSSVFLFGVSLVTPSSGNTYKFRFGQK